MALDLSTWTRKELRLWCEEHGLEASGGSLELQERIAEALAPGVQVAVWSEARNDFRSGHITELVYPNKFRVFYTDSQKYATHKLEETHLTILEDGAGSGSGEEEEDGTSSGWETDDGAVGGSRAAVPPTPQPRARDVVRTRGVACDWAAQENAAMYQAELERIAEQTSDWRKAELQDWCRKHDLPVSGTKWELQCRIAAHVNETADECGSEQEGSASEDGAAEIDLSDWSKNEMRAALAERDLPTWGSRDTLEQRLREALLLEADSESEEEEEELDVRLERQAAEYSCMAKADLQDFCRQLGLKVSGTKLDLQWRLAAHDLAQEDARECDSDESEDSEGDAADAFSSLHISDDPPRRSAGANSTGSGGQRKRALIVGISYRGQKGSLNGTLADARAIKRLLLDHFGFSNSRESMMVLTDDHDEAFLLPTKHNILLGFEWLMRDLRPGDSLFFYFTGHGSMERDPTGREPSGYNQVICPSDYKQAGCINDNRIHDMLVKELPLGVTLHALIDCCHSGTVMNLPYNAVLHSGRFVDWKEEYAKRAWKHNSAGGLVVQISAAKHDQLSVEMRLGQDGTIQGAATFAFVRAIENHHQLWGFNIVIGNLLQAMHDELRKHGRFNDQEPTLSATTAFDCMSSRFKLQL